MRAVLCFTLLGKEDRGREARPLRGHVSGRVEPVVRPATLERVMNLGENRIGMRIARSAWFLRDLRFPHS
jgi:hypothetical protein